MTNTVVMIWLAVYAWILSNSSETQMISDWMVAKCCCNWLKVLKMVRIWICISYPSWQILHFRCLKNARIWKICEKIQRRCDFNERTQAVTALYDPTISTEKNMDNRQWWMQKPRLKSVTTFFHSFNLYVTYQTLIAGDEVQTSSTRPQPNPPWPSHNEVCGDAGQLVIMYVNFSKCKNSIHVRILLLFRIFGKKYLLYPHTFVPVLSHQCCAKSVSMVFWTESLRLAQHCPVLSSCCVFFQCISMSIQGYWKWIWKSI